MLSCEAVGCIMTPAGDQLPQRLLHVFSELRRLIAELRPDVVSVERLFFQTNVRTAMVVGQASGLALLAAAEAGLPVVQYTANEVKQAVAGYGSAPKEQVQKMVTAQLRLSEVPEPDDAADGLALALCHLASARLGLLTSARAPGGDALGNARVAATFNGLRLAGSGPASGPASGPPNRGGIR